MVVGTYVMLLLVKNQEFEDFFFQISFLTVFKQIKNIWFLKKKVTFTKLKYFSV